MAIITEINEKNTEIQRQIYAQINEYDIRWWIHLFFLLFSRLSVNIVFFLESLWVDNKTKCPFCLQRPSISYGCKFSFNGCPNRMTYRLCVCVCVMLSQGLPRQIDSCTCIAMHTRSFDRLYDRQIAWPTGYHFVYIILHNAHGIGWFILMKFKPVNLFDTRSNGFYWSWCVCVCENVTIK